MISCMNTITKGTRGRLNQAHLEDGRRTVTWLSLRDLIIVWKGFRETIRRSHCSGNGKSSAKRPKERYLPVEKYPHLLLHFYDTYTYCYIFQNLLAFCSGSPAPSRSSILYIPIIVESDNDILVYALEKIIAYARNHQHILLAQSD
jgi:hypothetical protein